MSLMPSDNLGSPEFCLPVKTADNTSDNSPTTIPFDYDVTEKSYKYQDQSLLQSGDDSDEILDATPFAPNFDEDSTQEDIVVAKTTFHPTALPVVTVAASTQEGFETLEGELLQRLQALGIDLHDLENMNSQELADLISNLVEPIPDVTSQFPDVDGDEKKQEIQEDVRAMILSVHLNPDDFDLDDPLVVKSILHIFSENTDDDDTDTRRRRRDVITSSMTQLTSRLAELNTEYLHADNSLMFYVVLLMIIVERLFSLDIDLFIDDLWYNFLDSFDLVEKYGTHMRWHIIGYVLAPVLVTTLVDSTPCLLLDRFHHFVIHFYVYIFFIFIALLLLPLLPIVKTRKSPAVRQLSVLKGLRVICADCNAFALCVCVFILGFASAIVNNFLLWQVQDVGGSEFIFGCSIGIGAFVALVVNLLTRWIIYKISISGAVALAMLSLFIRLLVYALMTSAWPVLAVAGFQAFSDTLLLGVVENYPDFRLNPHTMDRNAKRAFYVFYTGLAYSIGSIASGFAYDTVGLSLLYLSVGCVAAFWLLVFCLVMWCKPRSSKRARYVRLLQEDAGDDTDDSESDDWLQAALKHDKK